MSTRNWSTQQQEIFEWFETPQAQHLVVRARAGTGKTTVIIEGVKRMPERNVLICAFSKIIQEELDRRTGHDKPVAFDTPEIIERRAALAEQYTHVTAKTLHAVGYACVRRFRDNIKVQFTNARADKLADAVCGRTAPDAIKKLVSKLHTKGREIKPHATTLGDLTAIAITFECEPDASWTSSGFGLDYVEQKALDAMALAADVKSGDTIDGSDMIFLPVRNHWLTRQYDAVIVDEAQDMTSAQLEIALGVVKENGRICIVGDDRQAIFGFRGADSGSLDRLKCELHASELGLTTTYRCGRAIVNVANAYVSDFQAGDTNSAGIVSSLHTNNLTAAAGPGDFVLSRVNAPLVATAMKLLRAGKRARVAGRDIGAGLIALMRRLKASSVPDMLRKIEAWDAKETSRLTAQMLAATNGRKEAIMAKIDNVHDQAEMLLSLVDGAKNVSEVEDRVLSLFTDDGLGAAGMITCSSVHRAKGLEADRVFVLRDTLRDGKTEEINICYVAVTRAKHELVWVSDNEQETN